MTAKQSSLSDIDRPFNHIKFLFSLRPTRMKLGLENISRLLELLGKPHKRFPSILVAGTNGKGSVTTFISSIMKSAGFEVGTFYSPHLVRVNERIRVNGEEIPSRDLDRIIGTLRKYRRRAPFTFFEGLVAAAAVYFDEMNVDAAVFEVGLGGRLDATRLVDAVLTVITGISLDHTEHLGPTRSRILKEKLGIVRAGVPLVANLPTKRLSSEAGRYCRNVRAPYHDLRSEVSWKIRSMELCGMSIDMETPMRRYPALGTKMIGEHQARNLATAIRAVEILSSEASKADGVVARRLDEYRRDRSGKGSSMQKRTNKSRSERTKLWKKLDQEGNIAAGVSKAFLPGRFQVLQGRPIIILDVSHNEEGLIASLETLKKVAGKGRKSIVFGVLEHKRVGLFPEKAVKVADEIAVASFKDRRSADPLVLKSLFEEATERSKARRPLIQSFSSLREALENVRGRMNEEDVLLVLGSHVVVEEAVRYL